MRQRAGSFLIGEIMVERRKSEETHECTSDCWVRKDDARARLSILVDRSLVPDQLSVRRRARLANAWRQRISKVPFVLDRFSAERNVWSGGYLKIVEQYPSQHILDVYW